MAKLKTRIERLETGTSEGIGNDARKLLIELAGRRDALHWPWRHHGKHRVPIHQRQVDYTAGVSGINAKADGTADWMPAHRARQTLINAGLVSARFSTGQVTSTFITEDGDAMVRGLVGSRLRSVREALPVLALMRTLDGKPFCGRRWVSESALFGRPLSGDPSEWESLTSLALPILARGLLVSNSDGFGRAYYALGERTALPDEVTTDGDCDPIADSVYFAAFNAERASLATLDDDSTGGEILIPIPASGWNG